MTHTYRRLALVAMTVVVGLLSMLFVVNHPESMILGGVLPVAMASTMAIVDVHQAKKSY